MLFNDVMKLAVSNKTAAAAELGISRSTLSRRIAPGGEFHGEYMAAAAALNLERAIVDLATITRQ